MSPARHAAITVTVGLVILFAGVGLTAVMFWTGGWPSGLPFLIAGLGLAVLLYGLLAWTRRERAAGFLLARSAWVTAVLLALAAGFLHHVTFGIRTRNHYAMRWHEAGEYFEDPSHAGGLVLSYVGHPRYFHPVDDERVCEMLRALPTREVEVTFEETRVFGRLRALRLVRVGDMESDGGFSVGSGRRGSHDSTTPWDADQR